MLMNTWHETKTNSSPDSLCQFSLADRPEAGLASVLYPAHSRHVFGHNREVLHLGLLPVSHTRCIVFDKSLAMALSGVPCIDLVG